MVESSDAGELINPEDNDNEVDEINWRTMLTLKRFNFHASDGLKQPNQENQSRENDAARALLALQQKCKPSGAQDEVYLTM